MSAVNGPRRRPTRVLRRLARGMGYATAGVAAGLVGVIGVEVLAAKLRRHASPAIGPGIRAAVGDPAAPTVRLTMLGDALAAGVGVRDVEDSLGGHLAELLAGDGCRIELDSVAVPGTRSADLNTQISRSLLGERPDVAVILVGLNDAISLTDPDEAGRSLGEAVARLTDAGVAVVVGACPDLGAARALGPPLRQIVSWLGRRICYAQAPAVTRAGGVTVDLALRTSAVFRADPNTISVDGFHPSADGYRIWAHALYPAVRDAVRSVRSA